MKNKKQNKLIILILTSFICLITIYKTISSNNIKFITNIISYIIIPPQKFINNLENKIYKKVTFFYDINKIREENKYIKEQLEEILKENNRMLVLEKDNINLRNLIETKQKYPSLSTIGADIIARDNNNWKNSFLIDKGKNDGIIENMIVLSSGALVGHISKVSANYSKVIPLIDDNSSIGATSLRTGDFGFVKGSLELNKRGLAKMDFIDLESELVEGDEIVTSNLSKIYPPGIIIGYVKEINLDSNSPTGSAIIQPVVNFKSLETVLIVNELFIKKFEQ